MSASTSNSDDLAPQEQMTSAPPKEKRSTPFMGQGNMVTIAFGIGVMIIVLGTVLVGAVDSWWILIPVFIGVITCTFAVIRVIGGLLNSEDDGYDDEPFAPGH